MCKPVELYSHADTCVVGDNFLVIHKYNKSVNVYSYDPNDGHRKTKLVDAAKSEVYYNEKSIPINGLESHLLCPMQCCLNGVHISEVLKFLSVSSNVTTNAIELPNPFDAAHPLTILHQLSSVTNYFDVYSQSIAEYENEDIPKFHLTTEVPPWDPSRN